MSVVRKLGKFITRRAKRAQNNLQLTSRMSSILADLDVNHTELLNEARNQIDSYLLSNCEKSRKMRVEGAKYNSLSAKDAGLKNMGKTFLNFSLHFNDI